MRGLLQTCGGVIAALQIRTVPAARYSSEQITLSCGGHPVIASRLRVRAFSRFCDARPLAGNKSRRAPILLRDSRLSSAKAMWQPARCGGGSN